MKFRKMHGLGNDFVVLDYRDGSKAALTPEWIVHICERNFGVGCDLLMVLELSKNADVFARFYNADGSESAACGNATRCAADIIMREQGGDTCVVETGRGMLSCVRADDDMVSVDMGAPLAVHDIQSPHGDLPNPVTVDMGNPHCVFFVEDLEAIDPTALGSLIESNTALFPNRTNVEFVQVIGENKMRQITWERGCGITLACGSGACATTVAGLHKGLIDGRCEIVLDGGSLFIERREDDGNILMTGPVAYVFEGEMNER